MTIKTEPKRVHDLLLFEVDQRFCRESVTVANDTGAAATFVIGQTLELDTNHYDVADGTAFNAILLENLDELANGASVAKVAVLVRGPALVNASELVFDSSATSASQLATMLAAGIKTVSEPTNTTEG